MIKVVFFAQLREQLQCAELHVEPVAVKSIHDLRQYLIAQRPDWAEFLQNNNLLIARNHEYARGDSVLASGDEVAFFPPVTGG